MISPSGLGEKIGLFGGTFDPVHNGHLSAAAEVRDSLSLDSVLFIPAPYPPHKIVHNLSSFEDRVAMLECAVAEMHGFFVSRIEADRSTFSYTIDTLKILQTSLGEEAVIFFILGLDSFMELDTWKDYPALTDYANLAVIDRPSFSLEDFSCKLNELYEAFRQEELYGVWSRNGIPGKIYHLKITAQDISSTAIREMVCRGESISGLVPDCVAKYIYAHHLYLYKDE